MTQQLSMPQFVIKSADLSLKSLISTTRTANTSTFFDALEIDHAVQNYGSNTTTTTADTSKQTIASLTGAGVLTHIMASALSAAGTMTVTVTIDGGTPKEFTTSTTAADTPRLCIGDFRQWQASASNRATSIGSKQDQGFGLLMKATMTSPLQAITDRNIGMIFLESALVEIQGSVNLETTVNGEAAIAYLTYIPRGLE